MNALRSAHTLPPALRPTALTPTPMATRRKPRIINTLHRSLGARMPITAAYFIAVRVVLANATAT